MTELADRIRASFDRQNMMTTLGVRVETIEEGRVVLSAPILPVALQQHGVGHAALTFAIGDTAAGYAAMTTMPADAEVMTAEMKISLLSPTKGDRLVAEGRVIRAGRRLTVVTADVWAETGADRKHVAILQGTMIAVPAGGQAAG